MHFVIFEEDKKKKTVQHVDLYEKENDVMLRKMKPMCILQGFDPYLEFPPTHTKKKKIQRKHRLRAGGAPSCFPETPRYPRGAREFLFFVANNVPFKVSSTIAIHKDLVLGPIILFSAGGQKLLNI